MAGALALVAVVVALVLAGGGTAASGNICISPTSPGHPEASCVTEALGPAFITANGNSISATQFTNQSGKSGATATHVVLSVTFTPAVPTVSSLDFKVNGSSVALSNCTADNGAINLPLSNVTKITCAAGNIAGGGTAKIRAEFSTSVNEALTAEVDYGEGGGNPSNVPNDQQFRHATLGIFGTANNPTGAGNCFAVPPGAQIGGGDGNQQTFVSGVAANGNFPCTFIDAGVDPTTPANGHTEVSFVQFPQMAAGTFATVVIDFASTPQVPGFTWKNFPIYETDDTGGNQVTLAACPKNGVPSSGDTCIASRSKISNGGVEVVLDVTGSPFDGRYYG